MSQAESISPETRQENFEQAVALSLHLWPALTLAVQNKWNDGGDDPEEVRAWFAGAVIELFPDFAALARFHATPAVQNKKKPANLEEPELEDVESRLLQVMTDEFNVDVDDDSSFEVAEQIVNLRAACIKGEFDEVEKLRQRWASRKGQKVTMHQAPEQDQDTDWEDDDEEEDDDDDGDVKMDEAPKAPKEKQQPEIDEDGFTKVTKKR